MQSGHASRSLMNEEEDNYSEDYLDSSAAMPNPAKLRFKDLKQVEGQEL
jgi:hypothetical protein